MMTHDDFNLYHQFIYLHYQNILWEKQEIIIGKKRAGMGVDILYFMYVCRFLLYPTGNQAGRKESKTRLCLVSH